MGAKLTPAEDADLRRLHELSRYALSAPLVVARLMELRRRDRRGEVRRVQRRELAHQTWTWTDED
jgi:hypothetical protein